MYIKNKNKNIFLHVHGHYLKEGAVREDAHKQNKLWVSSLIKHVKKTCIFSGHVPPLPLLLKMQFFFSQN